MEFPAKLDHLAEIMEYVRLKAQELGVEERLSRKIELACEEAIVNIILYAYPYEKGILAIACEKNGKRLEVILKDYGIAFNPIDVEVNPQTDIPVEERKVGGLGIFLLRKIIDEASYVRENDTNILRLVFNI